MKRLSTEDELAGNREVVLILHLVLDSYAELRYGELLDGQGIRQGRFVSLTELTSAVKTWLDRQS